MNKAPVMMPINRRIGFYAHTDYIDAELKVRSLRYDKYWATNVIWPIMQKVDTHFMLERLEDEIFL